MPVLPEVVKAYSYIRFSTPQQALGDSLRRQTEKAAKYAMEHGLTLDTELNLRNL
jgi:DNA invertase Pin-like site-specific DNA recombinase